MPDGREKVRRNYKQASSRPGLFRGARRRGYVASYAIFILIGACLAAAASSSLVFITSTPGAIHRRAREKSSADREVIDAKKTN